MIAPLVPYALRGAIWYQGEHNTATEAKARLYPVQLPLLVDDWRTRWGSDFPFAWVQLPNFERKDFRPLVREAMLNSLSVKNTGMAVTIDIGEPNDNHPKNKQEVGRRLSLWALGTVYGQSVPATSGPLPERPQDPERRRGAELPAYRGGTRRRGGELKGFLIAGADQQWKPASATIEGNTVVVSHPDVTEPVAVRYAWDSNPDGNLYNGAGCPHRRSAPMTGSEGRRDPLGEPRAVSSSLGGRSSVRAGGSLVVWGRMKKFGRSLALPG